jgi:hypothetical protein
MRAKMAAVAPATVAATWVPLRTTVMFFAANQGSQMATTQAVPASA